MTLLTTILTILAISGVLGLILIIFFLLFLFYGWIETKILKRRIPEKIRKEVENERIKKSAGLGARNEYEGKGDDGNNRGTESEIGFNESGDKSLSGNKPVGERRSIQIQSFGNASKRKRKSKINWADFN